MEKKPLKRIIFLISCLMIFSPSMVLAQTKQDTDLYTKKATFFIIGGILIGVSLGIAVVTTIQKKIVII